MRQLQMLFRVEPNSSSDGLCDCCGTSTRQVTGFLYESDNEAVAAYLVKWTLGQVDTHGAIFDLIVGAWGEGTSGDDRVVVTLELWREGGSPSFFVVDASDRPAAKSEVARAGLKREDVIGTPLATQVFELVDSIWLLDPRIAEIAAA